jgi:hypothetical protein
MVKNRAKSPLSLKVEFLEWYMSRDPRKGTQAKWAKEHDLVPETVSRWIHDDSEFDQLLAAVERGQEKRKAQVIEVMYQRACDPEDPMGIQAASFLAKVMGWNKPEKVDVKVDRVAYVEPGTLRELSRELYPELKN